MTTVRPLATRWKEHCFLPRRTISTQCSSRPTTLKPSSSICTSPTCRTHPPPQRWIPSLTNPQSTPSTLISPGSTRPAAVCASASVEWSKPENSQRRLPAELHKPARECIDLPALDAVLFLHPLASVVDVVHSLGRAKRKSTD